MHVAWAGLLTPDEERARPSIAALREKVAGRLPHLPRFRQRLAFPPLRMGEPFWVDDPGFKLADHVTQLGPADQPVSLARFRELTDAVLSEPLDRERPLWQIYLVPRLADGRAGLVCKLHHAMVDGKSVVEVALLLFDSSKEASIETPRDWSPRQPPGGARLALDTVMAGATESLRAVRGIARMAGSRGDASLTATLRRAALAVERDVLRSAPPSHLNVPISSRRKLVWHSVRKSELARVRGGTAATVTDVCLTLVAGALREQALALGHEPQPLKVMVPVSMRGSGEQGALGNRISFAFIDLPVHLTSSRARLDHVVRSTIEFKCSGRASGMSVVLDALGNLPEPLKGRAARAAASARAYNLTVSSIPGPAAPVYVLGAELCEAYPVVPIADDHTLSIGVFGYRDRLFLGIYTDPSALSGVDQLPGALRAEMVSLQPVTRRRGHHSGGRRRGDSQPLAGTVGARVPK